MDIEDTNTGYNAAADEFCDLVKAGIIDPLKVCGESARLCLHVKCRSFVYSVKKAFFLLCPAILSFISMLQCSQVVRTALTDAASVSSLITTSEAVIVEMPEDKKMPGGMPAPPDMY